MTGVILSRLIPVFPNEKRILREFLPLC
jgi:hypothetical protein